MSNINTSTKLYGVFGDPISHSLSPVMHNRAFSQINYNAVYLAFQVRDIGRAITGARALGISGLSITIPHKVSVMEFLDKTDEMAMNIGAVNTIVNQDGYLTGYNSDGWGAVSALAEKTDIQGKKVVIIGAGGAARAIGFEILRQGGQVTICNRSADKGEVLAKALNADFCPLSAFGKIGCHILINTTPLGMTPNIETTPIQKSDLDKEMVVMDIVYNPLVTRLLKDAKAVGCLTISGVAMFVYQGAFQFEMWTKKKAPLDIMKDTVLEALGGIRRVD